MQPQFPKAVDLTCLSLIGLRGPTDNVIRCPALFVAPWGFTETPICRVCGCVPLVTKAGGPCRTLGESPGRDKPSVDVAGGRRGLGSQSLV
jgi:hypothetical protein